MTKRSEALGFQEWLDRNTESGAFVERGKKDLTRSAWANGRDYGIKIGRAEGLETLYEVLEEMGIRRRESKVRIEPPDDHITQADVFGDYH